MTRTVKEFMKDHARKQWELKHNTTSDHLTDDDVLILYYENKMNRENRMRCLI